MWKSVEEMKRRLNEPEYRNNILLFTHRILQANIQARKMLKLASTDLDKAVEIISPQRTVDMAKNIFVHGDFK